MKLRCPALPNTISKLMSLGMFVANVVLEGGSVMIIYNSQDSYCIEGYELTYDLALYIMIILGIIICDLVYVILIAIAMLCKRCNYGADINTIFYNITAGVICMFSITNLALKENCGNDAFPKLKDGTCSAASISGIIHIVNGVLCFLFISQDERSFVMNRAAHNP